MFEQVKDALVESLNIDGEGITPESRLKEDLEIDSLAAVELWKAPERLREAILEMIPKAHILKISDEELAALVTVEDIVKLIESKQ